MFKSCGWRALFCAAVAVLAQPVIGQETVEGRLLEILKKKGLIGEAEYKDLRELEKELREESDLESKLDERIGEMVSTLQEAAPTTSYVIGKGFGWETADGRFKLQLLGRFNIRVTSEFWDENPSTNDENETDFNVQRARLTFKGHAFEKWLGYEFEVGVAGDEADTNVTFPNGSTTRFSSRNRLMEVKDAFFDVKYWSALRLMGGQFKVPYSRHWLTSSSRLQFVERGPTQNVFSPGRSVGLMIHGSAGGENDDLFTYYAGAFDGEGENGTNNDEGLLWAGRLQITPFGQVKYTESDLKVSEKFKLAVGVNAWLNEDDNHVNQPDDWSVGFDIAAFYKGFFTLVEVHYRENGRTGAPDTEIFGWIAQLGYMITDQFEIAVRASNVDWDHNGSGDAARREYLVGFGYFWYEHNLKLQLDFGRIEDHEGDHTDNIDGWVGRIQFQMTF